MMRSIGAYTRRSYAAIYRRSYLQPSHHHLYLLRSSPPVKFPSISSRISELFSPFNSSFRLICSRISSSYVLTSFCGFSRHVGHIQLSSTRAEITFVHFRQIMAYAQSVLSHTTKASRERLPHGQGRVPGEVVGRWGVDMLGSEAG